MGPKDPEFGFYTPKTPQIGIKSVKIDALERENEFCLKSRLCGENGLHGHHPTMESGPGQGGKEGLL